MLSSKFQKKILFQKTDSWNKSLKKKPKICFDFFNTLRSNNRPECQKTFKKHWMYYTHKNNFNNMLLKFNNDEIY